MDLFAGGTDMVQLMREDLRNPDVVVDITVSVYGETA